MTDQHHVTEAKHQIWVYPAPTPVITCATPNIPYNDTAFTGTLHCLQCYDVNDTNCTTTTNNLVTDQFASLQVTVETPTGNENDTVVLVEQYIYGLTCCLDMGWQHCASGRNYNSMSGHAFLVGANSNKILMRVCYSKSCCTCRWQQTKKKKKGEVIAKEKEVLGEQKTDNKDHHCPHNFKGVIQIHGGHWHCFVHYSSVRN